MTFIHPNRALRTTKALWKKRSQLVSISFTLSCSRSKQLPHQSATRWQRIHDAWEDGHRSFLTAQGSCNVIHRLHGVSANAPEGWGRAELKLKVRKWRLNTGETYVFAKRFQHASRRVSIHFTQLISERSAPLRNGCWHEKTEYTDTFQFLKPEYYWPSKAARTMESAQFFLYHHVSIKWWLFKWIKYIHSLVERDSSNLCKFCQPSLKSVRSLPFFFIVICIRTTTIS